MNLHRYLQTKRRRCLMLKFPNMEHDEPYMAHGPARREKSSGPSTKPGEFDLHCLIAGHYQCRHDFERHNGYTAVTPDEHSNQ